MKCQMLPPGLSLLTNAFQFASEIVDSDFVSAVAQTGFWYVLLLLDLLHHHVRLSAPFIVFFGF